jgi:hypothetical protein
LVVTAVHLSPNPTILRLELSATIAHAPLLECVSLEAVKPRPIIVALELFCTETAGAPTLAAKLTTPKFLIMELEDTSVSPPLKGVLPPQDPTEEKFSELG